MVPVRHGHYALRLRFASEYVAQSHDCVPGESGTILVSLQQVWKPPFLAIQACILKLNLRYLVRHHYPSKYMRFLVPSTYYIRLKGWNALCTGPTDPWFTHAFWKRP